MGLLDFVEQDHRIGATAHGLGQIPSLVIPHIARGSPDQSSHRVLFHEFGHVDTEHGLFAVKEKVGKGSGQFCFADSSGTEEDERAQWAVWILQPGP